MKIQNIHNGVINELTRKEWEKLGKSQKVFRILDEKDSPKIKEQVLVNEIGKPKSEATGAQKPEKEKGKSNTKS